MTEEPGFFEKLTILIAVPAILVAQATLVFGGLILFWMALSNLGGMYSGEGEMSFTRFVLDVLGGLIGAVLCGAGLYIVYMYLTRNDKK